LYFSHCIEGGAKKLRVIITKTIFLMTELYNYLNSVSPIKDETWKKVKEMFTEKTLKKGDYFIKDGEMAKQIGFLTNGIIRAFYRNNEGTEYNKYFFLANNFVAGYSSLITNEPNKINQQALTDCRLLIINYADVVSLYESYQDFERFGRKLAELFFVHKEEREVDLVMLDADKRYLIFQQNFPCLEQMIPQYHIASYLGITPTQLSRIRRNLVKK